MDTSHIAQTAESDEFVTGAEAARRVGVSRALIDHWRRRGWIVQVPSAVTGRSGHYRLSDVRAMAATPRKPGWRKGRPRRQDPIGQSA